MPITKAIALTLTHGAIVHDNCEHYRYRVSGRCQTWVRQPAKFRLPVKHGLYQYGAITETNGHLFEVGEPPAKPETPHTKALRAIAAFTNAALDSQYTDNPPS